MPVVARLVRSDDDDAGGRCEDDRLAWVSARPKYCNYGPYGTLCLCRNEIIVRNHEVHHFPFERNIVRQITLKIGNEDVHVPQCDFLDALYRHLTEPRSATLITDLDSNRALYTEGTLLKVAFTNELIDISDACDLGDLILMEFVDIPFVHATWPQDLTAALRANPTDQYADAEDPAAEPAQPESDDDDGILRTL